MYIVQYSIQVKSKADEYEQYMNIEHAIARTSRLIQDSTVHFYIESDWLSALVARVIFGQKTIYYVLLSAQFTAEK